VTDTPVRLRIHASSLPKGNQNYMISITNLNQKKAELISTATALVERGLNSQEDKQAHKKLIVEIDSTQEHIDLLSRLERSTPAPAPAPVAAPVAAPAVITQRDSKEYRAKVNTAARVYFRGNHLNAEQRALLTTSDAGGGALISQSFDDAFTEASKWFGPIYNLVHRKDAPNSEPTKFVVTDGTNQTFRLLTQGTTSASSGAQQPTIFSTIANTDTLISSVIYSVQELDDAFDLNSFLTRIAGTAVSRARETAITLGTTNDGSNTALPSCPVGGLLGSIVTGATTGSLAAGIGYDDLVSLSGSVDHSYYTSGAYMASPSVHTYLLSQRDSTSRPFYLVDPVTGLLMINGKPLYVNAAMPVYNAASSPVVLFGDYSKAWNVLNGGLRLTAIGNDGSSALTLLTRELIIWTSLGQTAGLSSAVKALVTAAS
jgi:HK97 family phage major capsid protein